MTINTVTEGYCDGCGKSVASYSIDEIDNWIWVSIPPRKIVDAEKYSNCPPMTERETFHFCKKVCLITWLKIYDPKQTIVVAIA